MREVSRFLNCFAAFVLHALELHQTCEIERAQCDALGKRCMCELAALGWNLDARWITEHITTQKVTKEPDNLSNLDSSKDLGTRMSMEPAQPKASVVTWHFL